jgi:glutathione peroxidase-family protein
MITSERLAKVVEPAPYTRPGGFDPFTYKTRSSIFDVKIDAADGTPDLLSKHKGKAIMIVNTTVGCGNANQLEVLQMLQKEYESKGFTVIGVPTNDYCGPGVTRGKWSKGITCGSDSQAYGLDVYGTTFDYTVMTNSNPNDLSSVTVGAEPGHNGNGDPYGEPSELWKVIAGQANEVHDENFKNGIHQGFKDTGEYSSWWLCFGDSVDNGGIQAGNFEKYLFDTEGYLVRHYNLQVLTYDHEATLKAVNIEEERQHSMAQGRTRKVFEEEYAAVKKNIEQVLSGRKSPINPLNS